ncbi:hypothetical protein ACVBGC_11635 [Burkholderia stagnalis]
MKNEIVTPAGPDGEAARRRGLPGVAARVALACLCVALAPRAGAAPAESCDAQLTRLIVPALRRTAMDRRTIHAALDDRQGSVHSVRLFVVPADPGTPNRDATIGWVTLDTRTLRALDVTRDPDRPDRLRIDPHAMARFVSACVAPPRPAPAAAVDCDALNRRAQRQGAYVAGSDAGRVVTGQGRLPFHSAPDDACRIPGLFVVEHDAVDARTEYGRFTSVVYLSVRTGGPVEGWVETARLKPNGTGIAPRQP